MKGRPWALIIMAVSTLCAGVMLFVILPIWIVDLEVHPGAVAATDRLAAIGAARTAMLQLAAGVAVLIGAYATWRRLRVSEEELRATLDARVTERYTRAVDQIGNANVNVRLGGIYALERIAKNSATDLDTIISIVSTFVRGHAPWPPWLPGQYLADVPLEDLPSLESRSTDVQAAVAVLGRIPSRPDSPYIRLPGTDLRRARMYDLKLDRALLGRASLRGARLQNTSLIRADLGEADLGSANLTNADLSEANLRGSDLRGANLTGARLDAAQLDGARVDADTRWPDGLDLDGRGVVRE